MINITKNGNVSVITFTDSDFYLFNSGQIIAPLGSLTMILDKSDMVTIRKSSNNDLLFSAKLGKIKINGVFLTKQNAQTLFDEALGGSGGSVLKFEEVQQLPQTGENGVIYLVPNGDNTFTEWVWLEDEERFEKLGYDVDLSNYYNKTQVDGLLANKQNTLTFDTTPTSGSTNPVTSGGIVTYLLNNYYNNQWVDMHLLELQQAMNAAIAGIEENYQPLLDFDSAPTSGSTNPVTSGGIYNAYYTKDEIDEGNQVVSTALNRLNNDVVELQSDLDANYYTESEVDTALAAKQNTLTFDSAPTQNSTNPVTSGGLYIVLGDIDTALATIIGSNS